MVGTRGRREGSRGGRKRRRALVGIRCRLMCRGISKVSGYRHDNSHWSTTAKTPLPPQTQHVIFFNYIYIVIFFFLFQATIFFSVLGY